MNIYLDIETGPLPVEKREFLRPDAASIKTGNLKDLAKINDKIVQAVREWEAGEGCALDPMQGEILVIGVAIGDTDVIQMHENGERDILERFWEMIGKAANSNPHFIGHNIRFDAGFLIKRSLAHGVKMPGLYVRDLFSYAPLFWRDTMQAWMLGDRRADMVSLKKLCGFFGVEVKDGDITGANFAENWHGGNKTECLAYNAQDVEATRAVYKRMEQLFPTND
ncbi:MAG TPA: ribonuclease H-like domain-containing protein [Rugosibacter sp.]|nr:ribonuclease H-like domain-containing protein [Rugosibacter sp.]